MKAINSVAAMMWFRWFGTGFMVLLVFASRYFYPQLYSWPVAAALVAMGAAIFLLTPRQILLDPRPVAGAIWMQVGFGAAFVAFGLTALGCSLAVHYPDLNEWFSIHFNSGYLPFQVSAITFGMHLFSQGRHSRVCLEAFSQYFIYMVSIWFLGLGYETSPDLPGVGLLSWAVFFISNDWAVIDCYVIEAGKRLGIWDYLRLLLFNAIVLALTGVVWFQLTVHPNSPLKNTAWANGFGAKWMIVISPCWFWILSAVLLGRLLLRKEVAVPERDAGEELSEREEVPAKESAMR